MIPHLAKQHVVKKTEKSGGGRPSFNLRDLNKLAGGPARPDAQPFSERDMSRPINMPSKKCDFRGTWTSKSKKQKNMPRTFRYIPEHGTSFNPKLHTGNVGSEKKKV